SSVSSTFIQFHHTQSRSQLHQKTLARAWCGRKTAVAKNTRPPAVHYRIPPGHLTTPCLSSLRRGGPALTAYRIANAIRRARRPLLSRLTCPCIPQALPCPP